MNLQKYALEYDEKLDAIASLEILTELLPKVLTVSHYWKWAILALHSALQGFMVLALQGTNDLNVLTKESAKAWLEAYESDTIPSKQAKLDFFMSLYEKIKSDSMLLLGHSRKFVPQSDSDQRVERLNNERNNFIHYIPALSLMDMRAFSQLVIDIIPIIEFLVFESGNIRFYEPESSDRIKGFCSLAKLQAVGLLDYYGA